jgi:hypothetical protein
MSSSLAIGFVARVRAVPFFPAHTSALRKIAQGFMFDIMFDYRTKVRALNDC